MAGRTPWTTEGELPGSRDRSIHFIQERYDQAEIVRPYTKWDYEFRTEKDIGLVMARAYQVATSEPCAPVYMSVPREIMMAPMKGTTVYKSKHFAPSVSPQGDIDVLRQAARLLVQAQRPVVLVSRMGRHPEAVAALVKLAEKLALPVVSKNKYINFPTAHPLRATSGRSYIQEADVVLQIDHMVPYVPALYRPPADCKIISMDIDPVRLAQPLWGFPVDIPITCDSSKALPLLGELADDFITGAERQKFSNRRREMEAKYAAYMKSREAAIAAASTQVPISTTWLGHCVRQIVDENTIQITESSRGVSPAEKAQPGQYFGLPASSLGWAGGAALGAKLAAPDKTVITTQGDGSFVFCDPTAVLWTARQYRLPFLMVIVNNKQYLAVASGIPEFYPKGYVVKSGDWNGSSIDPPPDYKLVGQSCGGYGETVTDPAQLPAALQRGLDAVHGGTCAVIDVHVAA
jgi:acetolactate synthase-1/2/3 large subunit